MLMTFLYGLLCQSAGSKYSVVIGEILVNPGSVCV